MMQIPNLPTDNLYKFISIFGLALVAGSIYFDFTKVNELDKAIWESKKEQYDFKTGMEYAKNEKKKFDDEQEKNAPRDKIFDSILTSKIDPIYRNDSKAMSLEGLKFINKNYELLKIESENDLINKAAFIGHIEDRINRIEKQFRVRMEDKALLNEGFLLISYNKWSRRVYFLFWVGIGITLTGFILWYQRRQKYEDTILKYQATSDYKKP